MASFESDPPEFVGRDQTTKADPKGKRATPAPVVVPVPSVAVYNPPLAGEAHPKIARKSVAERLDKAEANLTSANLELTASKAHLRSCELIEADALSAFIKACPAPPSADEIYRAHIKREQDAKLERVAKGLPPVEPKKIAARSPIDLAAAQRPRTSQAMPTGTPLRSPIARRIV
ncbi:hypothetical protein SAMN05443247_03118 [Bradyrhizobium erythrophlei]|nr:hypothetical protein SAMN05443247_03118 [Bradyrhizobium erythrophlei]